MKKMLSVLLVALLALPMSAQMAYRNGNTYLADGQTMKKQAFAEYMQQNAEANLANQFSNGLKVANAGWGLFGGGLAMEFVGIICSASGISKTSKTIYNMADGTSIDNVDVTRTVVNNTGVAAAGVAFYIIGSCAVTASIVCLGVGYARMHNSADIYMANYNNARKPQAYLQLQTSKDGLGLALKF